MLSSTREVYYRSIWWGDSTLGKAVTCTVSSCIGQNHRPSNCTNNYLRPKWAVSPAVINWMQQPVHANHRNTYHLTLNVITSMLNAQQTCLLVYSYTAVVIILTMWDILLHKKNPQAYYTTKQKLQKKTKKNTCASTYHRFCWNCRPQCLQHVCTWSDPRHTFYCRESSWVCKQTTIWTFKITPLSVKKHTKNISLKLSIVLFILSVYVLHQFKTK